jgi:hypothetical protein
MKDHPVAMEAHPGLVEVYRGAMEPHPVALEAQPGVWKLILCLWKYSKFREIKTILV